MLLQGDTDASKLCGSNLPSKMYNVSGNTLKLSFKSGQENWDKLGFIATYVSGKGALIPLVIIINDHQILQQLSKKSIFAW